MTEIERVKRMDWLFNRAAREVNPEQKEAYLERLDQHWQLYLDFLEAEETKSW